MHINTNSALNFLLLDISQYSFAAAITQWEFCMEANADLFLEQIAFDNVCRNVSKQSMWLGQNGCGFDILLAGICIFVKSLYGFGGYGSAAVMDSKVMQCEAMASCLRPMERANKLAVG